MAYTYDDFVTAANNAGLMNRFSQKDLDTAQKNPEYGLSMLSLIQDGDKATTAEQRLLTTEAVNQLRKNYGIYEAPGASFASSEGSSIQDTMSKIENYGPFTYDPEQDGSYVNYRAAALRESKRATEDALARASASTGGVASTAAVVAAQQAADYYNSKIADASASFEQTAYQRYLNGLGALNDRLTMLQKQDAADYNRYLQEEALKQQNAKMLRQQADLMAKAGDFSGYKALGMTDDWIAKMQNAYITKQSDTGSVPGETTNGGDGASIVGAAVNGAAVDATNATSPAVTQFQSPNMNPDGTYTVNGRPMTVEELRDGVANGTIQWTYNNLTGQITYSLRRFNGAGAGGRTADVQWNIKGD